jgi:hypothetical protein
MPTLYCPKCGYNLTALTENRCPECGGAFDPRQLRALQRAGISTRSVVLQLIFVPAGFALLSTFCLFSVAMSGDGGVATLVFAGLMLLAAVTLHAVPLAKAFVRSRQLREGCDAVGPFFRTAWPCALLFIFAEAALTFAYFAGGCAVIIINMSFH